MTARNTWMVRAGRGSVWALDFQNNGIVAVGWNIGDLSAAQTRDDIHAIVRRQFPDRREREITSIVSPLARFRFEMNVGDSVVTYDGEKRTYAIGRIQGTYRFDTSTLPELPHKRDVSWERSIPREQLSVVARNTLGSIMTLFVIGDRARVELGLAPGTAPSLPTDTTRAAPTPQEPDSLTTTSLDEDQTPEDLRRDSQSKAREFIIDRVNSLDWDDLQELVAGVLRAMGYKTRVSAAGPDRGCDIVASPDGLGLSAPRIFVEVKHREGRSDAPMLRSFIGGRREGDSGLFVSTGGFTKEARYEADRARTPVSLVDLDELVDLLIQHYPQVDAATRALVPLVPVFWPA